MSADRNLVQLAVKMTGDVRRRAVREKYSCRSRSGDVEYGVKGLLVRNLEHLRPEQFAKVMNILGADRHGQQILAAWIGKEKLRDALNLRAAVTRSTPCERDVRGRLASFYGSPSWKPARHTASGTRQTSADVFAWPVPGATAAHRTRRLGHHAW